MNKMFNMICQMTQSEVKKYVEQELCNTHTDVKVGDGFVYAQGKFPVLLVAHMDTVHKELPSKIVYDKKKQSVSSPNGIGGDDRCGIYMILQIIKKYHCSVLFCEDEEVGCIGAEKFIKTDIAKHLDFQYIIELDRKGNNDAVFYECDNPDFEEFITKEYFKKDFGSFTDISVIAPYIGCAAVNFSCGYYNAHTKEEYVVLPEMETVINEVCKLLERTTDKDYFEYIEADYDEWYYNGYDFPISHKKQRCLYYIEYVDEKGIDDQYETFANSEEEAVGIFCMENPHIPFCNVYSICSDMPFYM